MRRQFSNLFPYLKKLPQYSDYYDTCHELERDLLVVKTENEYIKAINDLK